MGIRSALQRHLKGEPWNVKYNIVDDLVFTQSNEVMTAIFKKLSREGLDKIKHHNAIESGDFKKLKDSGAIGTSNPVSLLNLVWLNIAMQFARRGREGYRSMQTDTFRVGVDGDGHRYIEHTFCEKTKNHQGKKAKDSYMAQGRIYEIIGDEFCPVRAFELYLSLLNPEVDCLWQKPNPNYLKTGYWYCRAPLGHNTLGCMMKNMCEKAKLSNTYTNHCTRVTTSVMLNEEGFNENDIIKVTGHSSTASLKSYNHRASTSKKREMSVAINNQMYGKTKRMDKGNNPIDNSVSELPVLACDELVELSDEQMDKYVVSYEKKLQVTKNLEGMFSNCIFNNATFNVTLNK